MPTGVYVRSEETKKRMSESGKRKIFTEKHRKNISRALKGEKHPNFGKKRPPFSEEWKKKLSEAKIGEKNPMYGKSCWLGKKHTEETLKKMSEAMKGEKNPNWGKMGEKNPNWRGGKSFEPYGVDWTKTLKRAIRERDNYICQLCGKTQIEELEEIEQKLGVHHIDYCKKNNNPNNLITLCNKCHLKTNYNRDYWVNYFRCHDSGIYEEVCVNNCKAEGDFDRN